MDVVPFAHSEEWVIPSVSGFVEAIMPEGSTQRTACRHQVLKITVCTSFYFFA
jgi:hypothetical protein